MADDQESGVMSDGTKTFIGRARTETVERLGAQATGEWRRYINEAAEATQHALELHAEAVRAGQRWMEVVWRNYTDLTYGLVRACLSAQR